MAAFPSASRPLFALALAATLAGAGSSALAQQVGVNSAVNPDATGTPPGASSRQLVIGQEILHDERLNTGPNGQTQLLFLDELAMTVGPSSDVTIDNFVYDPNTGKGQLAMSATRGVMRFVGGKLSKLENAVSLTTPVATIGIRGGVFLASVTPNGETAVTFLYGQGLTVTAAGATQTITRPGFFVSVSGPGAAPSKPAPAPSNAIAATLGEFSGHRGSSGGSSKPPTEANVAGSGIANTVSGNVAASVQQAALNAPIPTTQPPVINVASVQSNLNINTTASQAAPQIVQSQSNVAIKIAGLVKVAPGSTTGFIDQTATGRIPYTGTITYPVGSGLRNGVVTGIASTDGSLLTLSGLTAGATTNVVGTSSTANYPAVGTAFTSADSDFFYANLFGTGPGGTNVFVFGGTPVSQTFFAPTPTPQFYAFTVQPDAALANGSQAQTIPFLPSFAGGTMANAVASPLYLVTQPNQAFGNYNPNSNPNGASPHFLQASLAVNGAGANQSSALVLAQGSFFTSSDTGTVAAAGPVRGVYQSGTSLKRLAAGLATVPDANGNNLFGSSSIDGFVLDQNTYNPNLNFQQQLASVNSNGSGGGASTSYAFNQPVTATMLPSGVGSVRSALNETGYFGGVTTNLAGQQYVLVGTTSVQTNPSNSSLFAQFAGTDPFTPSTSKVSSIVLPFGVSSGRDYSRSTFIDNNIYAAAESPTTAVQINGTAYPTYVSGAATYPQMALVTSATVPGATNSLLPAGASFCACQFLQWGYWEASIPSTTASGATAIGLTTYLNTWLAGQPTVTLPTSGTGTYNGAAIGTVYNNGASYLAAGGFNNSYNFGSNSGTVIINSFDGANYSAAVGGSGNTYSGTLTGTPNRNGIVIGSFYGPGAVETGGTFSIQSTAGVKYLASGIFAGR